MGRVWGQGASKIRKQIYFAFVGDDKNERRRVEAVDHMIHTAQTSTSLQEQRMPLTTQLSHIPELRDEQVFLGQECEAVIRAAREALIRQPSQSWRRALCVACKGSYHSFHLEGDQEHNF